MIFGRYFLWLTGMEFCFDTGVVTWLSARITMKPVDYFISSSFMGDYAFYLQWLDKMFLAVSNKMEDTELLSSLDSRCGRQTRTLRN